MGGQIYMHGIMKALAAILLLPAVALAIVSFLIKDDVDDLSFAYKLRESDIPADLSSLMSEARSIAENLTDDELTDNFGVPVDRPNKSYAVSVALRERGGSFGGLGFSRMVTKFYSIGKLGGVERYTAFYSGGVTASRTFVLLKTDGNFPKLDSKEKLAARIAWERSKWPGMIALLQDVTHKKQAAK